MPEQPDLEQLELDLEQAHSRDDLRAILRPIRLEHENHREAPVPTCPFCMGDIT